MPTAGGGTPPTQNTRLIIVPDALIPDGDANENRYALHPALHPVQARLRRSAVSWAEVRAMAPIEWYAALIGVRDGASSLLAAALGDAVPAIVRQAWLFSPFAGQLARDSVRIMPEALFAWDGHDAEWLAQTLQPMLAEDGITLLVRDACLLALGEQQWDARPASFARISGHLLPDRHPAGADGGRLMRLGAEMQMLLASRPSVRRRAAGLPDVMGVWLWGPSTLPAAPCARPAPVVGDALIRACADGGRLPAAIMHAAGIEAWLEHQPFPRYWLLAGENHAALADTRALPRLGRRVWQVRSAGAFDALLGRLRGIVGGTAV